MNSADQQRSFVLGIIDEMDSHAARERATAAALEGLSARLNLDAAVFVDDARLEGAIIYPPEEADDPARGEWATEFANCT